MRLVATIGTTAYYLTVLADSYSIDEHCGTAGKHATSSVHVSVRPFTDDGVNFSAALFGADGLVSAVLKEGTDVVFTGYIRPYVSSSSNGNYAGNLSLEIMDPTEDMHRYIWPTDEETADIKENVYHSSTLKAIISDLFDVVGKTCDTSALDDVTIPYLNISSGEYVDEVIEEILLEYGFDYKWSASGVALFFPTFYTSTSSCGSITDIRNEVSTQRSDDSTDGFKIKYTVYKEASNVLIYSVSYSTGFSWIPFSTHSADLDGNFFNGVQHDRYFNHNAAVPATTNLLKWNFQNSKLKDTNGAVIASPNVYNVTTDMSRISYWLDDEDGVTLTPTLESYDALGARFWIHYSGEFNYGWTWNIKIYGDVGYGIESEESFNVIGESPKEITLKYRLLTDQTGVSGIETYANSYALREKASKTTYSFQSLTSYDVGGFYTLTNSVEGRSQVVRITSRSKDADGIYSYKAEGASTSSEVEVTTAYSGGVPYVREEENVFILKASRNTYDKDLRDTTGSTTVIIDCDVAGYGGTPTITCTTDSSLYSDGTLTIPKNTTYDSITMTATLDGAPTQTLILTAVDTTEYGAYIGTSTSGAVVIDGDVYFDTSSKLLQYRKNGSWVTLSSAGLTSAEVSRFCALAQKDALSVIPAGSYTASDYGYFNNVIADTVTANYIGAQTIELNNGGSIKSSDFEFGDGTWTSYDVYSNSGSGSLAFSQLIAKMISVGCTPGGGKFTGTVTFNGVTVGSSSTVSSYVISSNMLECTFSDSSHSIKVAYDIGASDDSGNNYHSGALYIDGSVVTFSSYAISINIVRSVSCPVTTGIIPKDYKYSTDYTTFVGAMGKPFDYGFFDSLYTNNLLINASSEYTPNFTASNEGSTQLPNGLILKWKIRDAISTYSTDVETWTFMDPFPTECLWAFASALHRSTSSENNLGYVINYSWSYVSFLLHLDYDYRYLAIGY